MFLSFVEISYTLYCKNCHSLAHSVGYLQSNAYMHLNAMSIALNGLHSVANNEILVVGGGRQRQAAASGGGMRTAPLRSDGMRAI